MTERVRERHRGGGDSQEYVEVEVTIHGTYLGKVSVKRGATLQEVLEVVREKAKNKGITIENLETWNIMLNDKRFDLEATVVVTENAILVLSQRIVGGFLPESS